MLKYLKYYSIAALITLSVLPVSHASARQTVCTMTFNSNNEAEILKKKLTSELGTQVEFQELVQADSTAEDLIPNACQSLSDSQTRCDILIISAHFGGSFFSEKTGLTVPLEEFEKRSCDLRDTCQQRLFNAKEVYLFGCNTLAGKDHDSRTPEDYVRVLEDDGFTPEVSRATAAFRYADYGRSNGVRMAGIFAKTPLIYGFSSIAPSGTTVTPFLQRFTKSVPSYFRNQFQSIVNHKNTSLAAAMAGTAFAQTQGLLINKVAGDFDSRQLFCRLSNPDTAFETFVAFANRKRFSEAFPQFLDAVSNSTDILKDFPKIRELASSEDFKKYVRSIQPIFDADPSLNMKMNRFELILGWRSEADVFENVRRIFLRYLKNQDVYVDVPNEFFDQQQSLHLSLETLRARPIITLAEVDRELPNWRKNGNVLHALSLVGSIDKDLNLVLLRIGHDNDFLNTSLKAFPRLFSPIIAQWAIENDKAPSDAELATPFASAAFDMRTEDFRRLLKELSPTKETLKEIKSYDRSLFDRISHLDSENGEFNSGYK